MPDSGQQNGNVYFINWVMTHITHENSHAQFFVDENILFLGLF